MQSYPITKIGYEKLKESIHDIKFSKIPTNAEAIRVAHSYGDLSENAEYHAAKEQQKILQLTLIDLEDKLARSQIIDPSILNCDTVKFGATVNLIDLDSDEEVQYTIMSDFEANMHAAKKNNEIYVISAMSPVAQGIIGKRVGDVIDVRVPAGTKSYEIHLISYKDVL